MKSILLVALACAVLAGTLASPAAAQDAERDRRELTDWLRKRIPNVDPGRYIHGAAAFGEPHHGLVPDANIRDELLTQGKQLWERRFRNGRQLAGCFPNGGKRIAATFPQFDARTNRVVTFEDAINRCLKTHGEPEIDFARNTDGAKLLAYARSLSDGQRGNVRILNAAAQKHYAAGKRFFYARQGQYNQACASCHLQHAGDILYDRVLTPAIGQTAQWPRLGADGRLLTLAMQYQTCLSRAGAAPLDTNADALRQLEFFHSALGNGLPLTALPAR